MERIRGLIEQREFAQARAGIAALEGRLAEEKAPHARALLQSQIQALKAQFYEETKPVLSAPSAKDDAEVEAAGPRFAGNCMKAHYADLASAEIAPATLAEVRFERCRDIRTGLLSCSGSAVLIGVTDSEVAVSAQQIRLIGCRGLVLRAHTATGIFLQDSAGISIAPLESGASANAYRTVEDFSCPFDSPNYTFL
ncbi:hypothetical protein PAPHI01_0690 [Pancytospora philotis]|nr:hypothetical protein PAPHI01_0690 [Pancytospora philotis]